MSDILIRGTELPTAEEEARLILITRTGRVIDMLCEEYEAIPDHGRLIDADSICMPYDICDGDEAMEFIKEAPTVIPASRGE